MAPLIQQALGDAKVEPVQLAEPVQDSGDNDWGALDEMLTGIEKQPVGKMEDYLTPMGPIDKTLAGNPNIVDRTMAGIQGAAGEAVDYLKDEAGKAWNRGPVDLALDTGRHFAAGADDLLALGMRHSPIGEIANLTAGADIGKPLNDAAQGLRQDAAPGGMIPGLLGSIPEFMLGEGALDLAGKGITKLIPQASKLIPQGAGMVASAGRRAGKDAVLMGGMTALDPNATPHEILQSAGLGALLGGALGALRRTHPELAAKIDKGEPLSQPEAQAVYETLTPEELQNLNEGWRQRTVGEPEIITPEAPAMPYRTGEQISPEADLVLGKTTPERPPVQDLAYASGLPQGRDLNAPAVMENPARPESGMAPDAQPFKYSTEDYKTMVQAVTQYATPTGEASPYEFFKNTGFEPKRVPGTDSYEIAFDGYGKQVFSNNETIGSFFKRIEDKTLNPPATVVANKLVRMKNGETSIQNYVDEVLNNPEVYELSDKVQAIQERKAAHQQGQQQTMFETATGPIEQHAQTLLDNFDRVRTVDDYMNAVNIAHGENAPHDLPGYKDLLSAKMVEAEARLSDSTLKSSVDLAMARETQGNPLPSPADSAPGVSSTPGISLSKQVDLSPSTHTSLDSSPGGLRPPDSFSRPVDLVDAQGRPMGEKPSNVVDLQGRPVDIGAKPDLVDASGKPLDLGRVPEVEKPSLEFDLSGIEETNSTPSLWW
jgi:hypothetical protein